MHTTTPHKNISTRNQQHAKTPRKNTKRPVHKKTAQPEHKNTSKTRAQKTSGHRITSATTKMTTTTTTIHMNTNTQTPAESTATGKHRQQKVPAPKHHWQKTYCCTFNRRGHARALDWHLLCLGLDCACYAAFELQLLCCCIVFRRPSVAAVFLH